MIRIAVLAFIVVAVWLLLRWSVNILKTREVDWPGVAFAIGFVVAAFWLHNATGFGHLFG